MTDIDYSRRWEQAQIPVQYRGMIFAHYKDLDSSAEAAKLTAIAYRNYFDEAVGSGLLFVGPPGQGKTMLACVTAMEIHRTCSTPEHPVNIFFAPFADYIYSKVEQMKWEKRKGEPDADARFWHLQRMFDRVNNCQLLVLDDVGKEHKTNSAFAEDELDRLLRSRYRRGLSTIVTSNVAVKDWAGNYGDAMGSFLKEAFKVVGVVGKDKRG